MMALLMPYRDAEYLQSDVINGYFRNHTDVWYRLASYEIGLKCLALVPIMLFGVIGNVSIVIVFIRMKVSVLYFFFSFD